MGTARSCHAAGQITSLPVRTSVAFGVLADDRKLLAAAKTMIGMPISVQKRMMSSCWSHNTKQPHESDYKTALIIPRSKINDVQLCSNCLDLSTRRLALFRHVLLPTSIFPATCCPNPHVCSVMSPIFELIARAPSEATAMGFANTIRITTLAGAASSLVIENNLDGLSAVNCVKTLPLGLQIHDRRNDLRRQRLWRRNVHAAAMI